MPGKMVKNWKMYEALRDEGYTKESAAKITNSSERRARTQSKRSKKRKNKRGSK